MERLEGSDMFDDEEVSTDAATRPRGRPKVMSDGDQRAHLVAVGRAVFLESGYGRATMDEVATRARVSKKTLYRFFANKLDLFAAVIEVHRRSMLSFSPDDHLPVEEALKAIVRLDIDADEDRERHALIESAFFEIVANPELRGVVFLHGVEKSRLELADWLRRRTARGDLAVADPDLVARFLMDMVFGASHPPRCCGGSEDPADRRRRLEGCIALFLDGTRPRIGTRSRPPVDDGVDADGASAGAAASDGGAPAGRGRAVRRRPEGRPVRARRSGA